MKRTPLTRRTPLRARQGMSTRTPLRPRGTRLRARVARPNTAQHAWRELVRDMGCVVSGGWPVEIHHCVGRTGRHDGGAIGHWWSLPLTRDEHQGPEGIHRNPNGKARERALFEHVLQRVGRAAMQAGCMPPGDVIEAIRSYHR